MILEWAKNEVAKGRGDESAHIIDVAREQEKRIENKQRKTRFVLVCSDPDICSEFEGHKNRIFLKVKNKSMMEHLMLRAWSDALSDSEIDRILAAEEMADGQENSQGTTAREH